MSLHSSLGNKSKTLSQKKKKKKETEKGGKRKNGSNAELVEETNLG